MRLAQINVVTLRFVTINRKVVDRVIKYKYFTDLPLNLWIFKIVRKCAKELNSISSLHCLREQKTLIASVQQSDCCVIIIILIRIFKNNNIAIRWTTKVILCIKSSYGDRYRPLTYSANQIQHFIPRFTRFKADLPVSIKLQKTR